MMTKPVHEALTEFHELLLVSSRDQPPPRYLAVRYQICRTALLTGRLKNSLPGFVRQCVSLLKFREFIHLYDGDLAERTKFIERSLEAAWTRLNKKPPQQSVVPNVGDLDPAPIWGAPAAANARHPDKHYDDFMADPEDRANEASM